MATCFSTPTPPTRTVGPCPKTALSSSVALLTGGFDRHYVFGLATALGAKGVWLDVIGSDEVDCPELHAAPALNFFNLRGSMREANLVSRISRVLLYYGRLLRYAATSKSRIFHVLWNNKFQSLDRTLLMMYYRLLGKKIVLTAHNVNAGRRDAKDSLLNRITLRAQYHLSNHIFVHTKKMKEEVKHDFGVGEETVSVIPYGINNCVPDTDLTAAEAKGQLGIKEGQKTILFFGAIRPYKGVEYLVDAFQRLTPRQQFRLIIAGAPKEGCETYLETLYCAIDRHANREHITRDIRFIPDAHIELYFKAADVLVLPYTHIFQSGVLFLSYSFGLPVVATDVGSMKDDVITGQTGFVCRPCDAVDLARTLERYFDSDLFKTLASRRKEIRDYANAWHSWDTVGEMTRAVYAELLHESAGLRTDRE